MFKIAYGNRKHGSAWDSVQLHELAHVPGMTLAAAEVCAAMLPGAIYEYGPEGERVKVERLADPQEFEHIETPPDAPKAATVDELREILQRAVNTWPQAGVETYGDDCQINGGDLVDWFSEWAPEVRELLAKGVA